jgi:acetylcholinesterase
MLFVQNTGPCATASPNNTLACLLATSPSDLLVGEIAGLALELFPFRPVLDGPEGIISDLPAKRLSRGAGGQVPFIAGTVLDEGLFVLALTGSMLIPTQGQSSFRRTFRLMKFLYR